MPKHQQPKIHGVIPLLLVATLAGGILASCSSSAPASKASDSSGGPVTATAAVPSTAPAAGSVPTADALAQGHDLFTQKCGTCHALPDPASHKAEKWPHLVEWMRQRSNLDTAEASKVLAWVLAERERLTAK
jgi:mono/diheme cytochrome c family protein